MLRKNRIFIISENNDGIESVFISDIIPRNFNTDEYFDIIKDVLSSTQAESKIQIGDKTINFSSQEVELDSFELKIALNIVYDNFYIINQLDRLVNIPIDCNNNALLFNDNIYDTGINITAKGIISLKLDKKVVVTKLHDGRIEYKRDEEDNFSDLEYEICSIDNLKEARKMENKMKDKLNMLDEKEKETAEQYFTKRHAIEALFSIIRTKFTFKEPFGNYNSKVIIIVDFDKMDDKILKLIKRFYEINSQDFYNIYLTPYNKTGNNKIDDKLLEKEIELINPDRVISLGYDNLNLISESMSMSKADYDYFYSCVGNKNLISSDEYKSKKVIFTDMMKFIITGER